MNSPAGFLIKTESCILYISNKTTYTGTVERDSFGRPYIQDETDAGAIVYDTGVLLTVTEIE